MIGSKVMTMKSGEFYIAMEFHRGGIATDKTTQSSSYIYIAFKTRRGSQTDRRPFPMTFHQ